MSNRFFVVILATILLASCASIPDKPEKSFDMSKRQFLYKKKAWFFSGRMSVIDEKRAVSANIEWKHRPQKEKIKLSGPFGLGRTEIVWTKNGVEIDVAGEQKKYMGAVDDIVSSELGVAVPISALKYWVLGVTDPNSDYIEKQDGFTQHGWRISYLQMQVNGDYELPRKIIAKQGKAKLKLIVNYWNM